LVPWAAALLCFLLRAEAQAPVAAPTDATPSIGAKVNYQLPTDGPLPKTYRVTIAAVDPKAPNWVISTFASGVVRTVTAENQGKFTETWDGLDDNFMPVPPGTYALKGIYMPAQTWPIDGQYHTIVPKLASIGCSWGQSPAEDALPNKIEGDPVGSPFRDVDVAPGGKGVLYFQYLENGTNSFMVDFTKPINYSQLLGGYPSGGLGGGLSACTDGKQIWVLGGGKPYIMHADGTPFGHQKSTFIDNVCMADGQVTGLTAWPDPQLGHSIVFVAERGVVIPPPPHDYRYKESTTDLVNKVVALDGNDSTLLATWTVDHPLSVKARGGKLYVLHGFDGKYEVDSLALDANWKQAQFATRLTVPTGITPFDLEVDSHGRFYLSDSAANHVYQFDAKGNRLITYGKLDVQKGGAYDPLSFMSPEKLSCWTDAQGKDRLLVVEQGGPNRLSEWSGDDGSLIRQWVTPQLEANDGYAVDPHHPDQIYMTGQLDTLVRWTVDYTSGQWTPNAVWFNVGTSHDGAGGFGDKLLQGLANPQMFYRGEDAYLAFRHGYVIYHFEGEKCRACAAIFRQKVDNKPHYYLWRDLNGDGQVQENEYLPFETVPPTGTLRYFGETWFDDLSLVAIGNGTPDIWRLAPTGYDSRGTPLFDPNGWKKLLTDDVFVAKAAGTATATRGGNEAPSKGYDCSWADVAPGNDGDIYVNARFGPGFSANNGVQFKLSRYVPDGKGGYTQRWRVGRMAIQGNAKPGEIYGPIFPGSPVNGLVGIVDSDRSGFEVYTEDGLYVDTLFPDARTMTHDAMGSYWQPGEYFSGYDYVNRDNGKIYLALGKVMPKIYEIAGWSPTQNPVQALTTLDKTVSIESSQIASPPEIALQVRGGAAAARVARFYPAPGGGPSLDGSMNGWEACDPVTFSSGPQQAIEARCYYDPDHIYIRWHARLGHKFEAKTIDPVQHFFAHDRGNDTLGLYLQGDPNAKPGASQPAGRPGDVRFVFGLFQDGAAIKPAVLGLYPAWTGAGATPHTYTTPVGSVTFAHVGLVPGVNAGYKIDDDGQGFVLTASIPRAAVPGANDFNGWHTEGNFDANLGGVDRFWWSNADGSASRETFDEPTESRFYPGSWSPIQFLAINTLPIHSWMAIGPFGFPGVVSLDIRKDRAAVIKTLTGSAFPPDTTRDLAATYDGDITHTRVAQRKLLWKEVELSTDLVDLRKSLNWSGYDDEGTVYLLTHISTPQAAQVSLNLAELHGQCFTSGQLNGKALPQVNNRGTTYIDVSQPLSLQAGWNELLIRYDHIWGSVELGGSLVADPAVLWKLKISGPLPEAAPTAPAGH
jgi:hypothetical protein